MKTKYNTKYSKESFVIHYSILWLMLLCITTVTTYAQSPQKMTYQSVVRDGSGSLLTNTAVGIQISILQGMPTGTNVYTETYAPNPQTNINGLVTVSIGGGTPSGALFSNIDWANGPYFLHVGIDPTGGTNYTINGTSQLLSVPYALYAETSGGSSGTSDGWNLSGNAGTNSTTDFIGTIDNQALKFRIENEPFGELNLSTRSIFLGERAGLNNTNIDNNIGFGSETLLNNTGARNIGIGASVLLNNTGTSNIGMGSRALEDNTSGNDNIGIGDQALEGNTSGNNNVAMGRQVLENNTIGSSNIGMGVITLRNNTTGNYNIGIGEQVLEANTTGSNNIGMGEQALFRNTLGISNIALGNLSLFSNEFGLQNIAIGSEALYFNEASNNIAVGNSALRANVGGAINIAIGLSALLNNTTGSNNTAIGYLSLEKNTTGSSNTAIGNNAMSSVTNGRDNTAVGSSVMPNVTSGQYNTALGNDAMASVTTSLNNTAIGKEAMPNATGSNNTAIGHEAEVPNPAASHQVRIGNSQITSATIQVPWTSPSDKKWKEHIRPLPYGLEVVSQLKPVDYVRKNNESNTRETGFIAQDVEKLLTKIGYTDQGLLSKDSKGGLSLRYNDFIALLTKAIQELNDSNKSLQKTNVELIKRIQKLEQQH